MDIRFAGGATSACAAGLAAMLAISAGCGLPDLGAALDGAAQTMPGEDPTPGDSEDGQDSSQPEDDGSDPGGGEAPGIDEADPQLRILLTDAPLDVDSVWVTISEVRVRHCPAGQDTDTPQDEDDGEVPADENDDGAEQGEAGPEDLPEPEEAPEQPDGAGETDDGAPGADEGSTPEPSEDPQEEPESGDCEDGSWMTVTETEATYDLLALQNGLSAEMGLSVLPAGTYGQIRLMLVEASVDVNGENFPLTIPSGAESGIKINYAFSLEPGAETVLILDFDAGKSVHHTPGNGWMMQPVIEVISAQSEPMAPVEPGDAPEEDDDTEESEEDEAPQGPGPSAPEPEMPEAPQAPSAP